MSLERKETAAVLEEPEVTPQVLQHKMYKRSNPSKQPLEINHFNFSHN